MIIHYRNGAGRSACRLLSDGIAVSARWGDVNCKACKQSYDYVVFLELSQKIK